MKTIYLYFQRIKSFIKFAFWLLLIFSFVIILFWVLGSIHPVFDIGVEDRIMKIFESLKQYWNNS